MNLFSVARRDIAWFLLHFFIYSFSEKEHEIQDKHAITQLYNNSVN